MPKINPELIRAARESAGLSLEDAAKKLGITSKNKTEKLANYENGEIPPSKALLQKMASTYHRNLLYFYLARPPLSEPRTKDFRTTIEGNNKPDQDKLLTIYLRNLETRQAILSSALADASQENKISFIGRLGSAATSTEIARSIQDLLGIGKEKLRAAKDPAKSFQLLRDAAEKANIFVVIERDLGSHHSEISLNTFRGIALEDKYAPFIVINAEDARAAWSFTLLHEIAHLLIGESGISGPRESDMPTERKCNEAASLFLLSDEELFQEKWPIAASDETLRDAIKNFARYRNLSQQMVAYRLYKANLLSYTRWAELDGELKCEIQQQRIEQKRVLTSSSGGPSYRITKAFRLGRGLVNTVSYLHKEDLLTTTKAAKILDIKPKSLDAIAQLAEA